ncbi:DUF6912 family protein [Puerhibacterium puerhi]|uniref:DUF6912 family protein n=1 Tax=Puerhibacterium puerhi TaxID=2692623 RepID=UPI00135B96E7|nr:hypothetical protein [Puerhibacterium puerhi]
MRLYVPATLDELASATVTATGATWCVPPRGAHAVTPALAGALPDEDEEGREYAAFLAAAHDSLLLVAARGDAVPLRVVVTVEVPDAVVLTAAGGGFDGGADDGAAVPSAVRVTREVPGTAVVAVHVDEPEAAGDVRDVLAAADEESDAEAADDVAAASESVLDDALQRVTDRDLLWYDPTEIAAIPRP